MILSSYEEMIDYCSRIAVRSTIRTHKTGCAILDKNGKVISHGWSHVSERQYITTPWSVHSEHHAIRRCHNLSEAHTIVIVTLTKAKRVTNGRPCAACLRKIQNAGIKHIIWSKRIET